MGTAKPRTVGRSAARVGTAARQLSAATASSGEQLRRLDRGRRHRRSDRLLDLFSLASKNVIAAVVMILAGIGAIVASVRFLKSPPIARPIAGISGTVLVLSSALGLSAKLSADSEAKATCERVFNEFTSSKRKESLPYDKAMAEFDRLSKEADIGIAACQKAGMSDSAAGLEAGKKELQRQKEAGQAKAKQQEEDDKKAAQAAAVAKKEGDWPDTQKAIKSNINLASTKANLGKWLEADSALSEASGQLNDLRGTKVEGAPEWSALSKQIEAQRQRIAPQVERMKKKEDEEKAKDALVSAVRGPEPPISPWDGACMPCERHIKTMMNDPDSYDHVTSTRPQIEGEYWTCVVQFRGKNAFGAKVINQRKCWIQQSQVVKSE